MLDEDAGGDRPRPVGDNLLTRAADVTLKERRRLVLMVRETPFNLAHLRNMTAVTEMGAVIFPPLPAFYHRPASIDEMVDDSVERVLALLGVAGAAPRAVERALQRAVSAAGGVVTTASMSQRRRAPNTSVRVLGPAAAAVVAAERHEQVAALAVEVVAQDHAAEAQVGLQVEQRGARRRRRSAAPRTASPACSRARRRC